MQENDENYQERSAGAPEERTAGKCYGKMLMAGRTWLPAGCNRFCLVAYSMSSGYRGIFLQGTNVGEDMGLWTPAAPARRLYNYSSEFTRILPARYTRFKCLS
ncbi:MAG: hypothetical protein A2234_07380 [Elusimicrobia bacterium RIFOXYA2_FULL_58_8]|nr:MAG: hypothetical protein A2234_07380 [Elusimicrobia bacterium RIFOXYA2_FULL_58_8]